MARCRPASRRCGSIPSSPPRHKGGARWSWSAWSRRKGVRGGGGARSWRDSPPTPLRATPLALQLRDNPPSSPSHRRRPQKGKCRVTETASSESQVAYVRVSLWQYTVYIHRQKAFVEPSFRVTDSGGGALTSVGRGSKPVSRPQQTCAVACGRPGPAGPASPQASRGDPGRRYAAAAGRKCVSESFSTSNRWLAQRQL